MGPSRIIDIFTYEITSRKRGGGGHKKCRQSHNFLHHIHGSNHLEIVCACLALHFFTISDGLAY